MDRAGERTSEVDMTDINIRHSIETDHRLDVFRYLEELSKRLYFVQQSPPSIVVSCSDKIIFDSRIPKQVVYNGVTTVAIFADGEKIISRPRKGELFDKETGLAMCIAKRVYGSRRAFMQAVEGANDQTKPMTIQEELDRR